MSILRACIEVRSKNHIVHLTQSFQDGDYADVQQLELKFYNPYFKSIPTGVYVAELSLMMEAVGRLEDLNDLEISPSICEAEQAEYCSLPVAALVPGLTNATNLQKLFLQSICLTGTKDAFAALGASMGEQEKLVHFLCWCETSKEGEGWANLPPLGPFIHSVSTIPTLKTFQVIETGINVTGVETEALENLCRLNLHCLVVNTYFGMSNEAAASIFAVFKQANKFWFQNLCFSFDELGTSGSEALVDYFSEANVKISKYLCLKVSSVDIKGTSAKTILKQVVTALGRSHCTECCFTFPCAQQAVAIESFKEMLRENYTIQDVSLGTLTDLENGKEIDFLLKLNKMGRGDLLRDKESDLNWIDLFNATEGDLDNIYFLVQSNPLKIVEFGLHDSSENLVSTMRTLKPLFRQNRYALKCAFKSETDEIMARISSHALYSKYSLSTLDNRLERIEAKLEIEGKIRALGDALETSIAKISNYSNNESTCNVGLLGTLLEEQLKDLAKTFESQLKENALYFHGCTRNTLNIVRQSISTLKEVEQKLATKKKLEDDEKRFITNVISKGKTPVVVGNMFGGTKKTSMQCNQGISAPRGFSLPPPFTFRTASAADTSGKQASALVTSAASAPFAFEAAAAPRTSSNPAPAPALSGLDPFVFEQTLISCAPVTAFDAPVPCPTQCNSEFVDCTQTPAPAFVASAPFVLGSTLAPGRFSAAVPVFGEPAPCSTGHNSGHIEKCAGGHSEENNILISIASRLHQIDSKLNEDGKKIGEKAVTKHDLLEVEKRLKSYVDNIVCHAKSEMKSEFQKCLNK